MEWKGVMTLIGIGGQVKCEPLRHSLSPCLPLSLSLRSFYHVCLFFSNNCIMRRTQPQQLNYTFVSIISPAGTLIIICLSYLNDLCWLPVMPRCLPPRESVQLSQTACHTVSFTDWNSHKSAII